MDSPMNSIEVPNEVPTGVAIPEIEQKKGLLESILPSDEWPKPLVENFDDPDWPDLSGSDESIRRWVLENKKVMMRVVTWNLCAKPPPGKDSMREKLLPKKFHVVMFGSEECERSIAQSALLPSKRNWESYLCQTLGESYVPLRAHTLQAIHIICFVHRSIANLCSIVTSAAVACGAGNTLGNKGAVSIFLKVCGTKILVVNAHLSAHQHAERRRNAEFRKISMQMPILLEQKDSGSANANVEIIKKEEESFQPVVSPSNAPQISEPAAVEETSFIINEGHVPKPISPEVVADTTGETANSSTPNMNIENAPTPLDDNDLDEDDEAESDMQDNSSPVPNTNNPRPLSNNFLPTNSGLSPAPPPGNTSNISASASANVKTIDTYADIVIFMGDLNYRIKGNRSIVDKLLARNMYEVLLNNDQLIFNMRQRQVLEQFTEAPLHFRPTYKFDRGTDVYDSGLKRRIPSWTDRILYKPCDEIVCLAYNSDMSISTSDHKPVYATFMVQLNTFVHLDENQHVQLSNPTDVKFTSESQVCTIM